MRLLVCGSRYYSDVIHIFKELNAYSHASVLIEGGARGVDTTAKGWAYSLNIPVEEYPADWNQYGTAAGPIRNKQMLVEGKPDLVIAFLPLASIGTTNMIRQAEEANIPVKVIEI